MTDATAADRTDHSPIPRPGSGAMFDAIAHRYDLLNRVLSLGSDGRWRRKTVAALQLQPGHRVLDLATGTGDVALEILAQQPQSQVIGLDPSPQMIHQAGLKARQAGLRDRLGFQLADAENLPFADDSFDALTIAFGIRNVPDRRRALSEMARVVRQGGRVAILELSEPQGGWLGHWARFHIRVLVPRIGAMLSGVQEYRYLQQSIAAFPPPQEFVELMQLAGLQVLETRALTFGVCMLYLGQPIGGGA